MKNKSLGKKASGSVLAISLILLTAITSIAMLGLHRSGLQTKIVSNLQHREAVFNAALNDIDGAYDQIQESNMQQLSDAMNKPNNWITYETGLAKNLNTAVFTHIQHVDNGNNLGNPDTSRLRNTHSRGQKGAGIEQFITHTSATLPNDIRSDQEIGITIIAP